MFDVNFNYSELKNETAVKNAMRENAFNLLVELLTEKLGSTEISIVDKNTVAVAIGSIEIDGISTELNVEFKPVAKEYKDKKRTSGERVEAYDRYEKAEEYEIELKEKREKEEQKKREKEREQQKRKKKAIEK